MNAHDRIAIDLATRNCWPAGHTIHMSLDHSDRAQSISVVQCDCGWEFRIVWPGNYQLQDQVIERHWQSVEKLPTQLDLTI